MRDARLQLCDAVFDQHAVLRDGEGVVAVGLAVPARDAGEAVSDVFDLDIEGGRVQKVESAAGQHPLPSPRFHRFLQFRHGPRGAFVRVQLLSLIG